MKIILMALVFLFGLLQPFQAGMNARMGEVLGDRFQAGFINGFTNVLLLSLVLLLFWRGFPSISLLKLAPWWAYCAGAIGAGIVVVQLSSAPILGAAVMVALFVAGQVGGSVLVDTLGLVGYPQRMPSMIRLLALAMILGGVVLATFSMRSAPSADDPGSGADTTVRDS
ncbi:MAG: DMT family transporter [Phycisphaerales bacterium]|jgi:transporter family-2 protein|nr:DMT family transporter [Phycisphaerales bacterium]